MSRTKDLTISSVVAVIAALITLAPAANYLLAGEVTKQVSPLIESQKILLGTALDDYRDTLTTLEFRRDTCSTPGCWSESDAKNLSRLQNKIRAAEDALKKLVP